MPAKEIAIEPNIDKQAFMQQAMDLHAFVNDTQANKVIAEMLAERVSAYLAEDMEAFLQGFDMMNSSQFS